MVVAVLLEHDTLWKHVVGSCNELDINVPIWESASSAKGGGPWSSICNIWKMDKDVEKITKNGI